MSKITGDLLEGSGRGLPPSVPIETCFEGNTLSPSYILVRLGGAFLTELFRTTRIEIGSTLDKGTRYPSWPIHVHPIPGNIR